MFSLYTILNTTKLILLTIMSNIALIAICSNWHPTSMRIWIDYMCFQKEGKVVQASLLGLILANLLLILGMCFMSGGLQFRGQVSLTEGDFHPLEPDLVAKFTILLSLKWVPCWMEDAFDVCSKCLPRFRIMVRFASCLQNSIWIGVVSNLWNKKIAQTPGFEATDASVFVQPQLITFAPYVWQQDDFSESEWKRTNES